MTRGMTLGPGFLRKIEFRCLFLFSKKIQRSLKKRAQLGSYFSITNGAEDKLLHLPWSWLPSLLAGYSYSSCVVMPHMHFVRIK